MVEEKERRIRELETELLNRNQTIAGLQNNSRPRGSHEKWTNLLRKPDWILNLISQKIGFDIADDIPDEHEEDAEFVTDRTMSLALISGAVEGRYTGWMLKGRLNGRGFFWSTSKNMLIEGRWKDGKQQGLGWKFEHLNGYGSCILGHWKEGHYTNGMDYFSDRGKGDIKSYNQRKADWITLTPPPL